MSDEITRGWRSWRVWDGSRWTAAGAPGAPPAEPGPVERTVSGLEISYPPGAAPRPAPEFAIQTSHIYPPIPMREFDWCAYRDPEWTPYGYGRTEKDAIQDLLDMEDEGGSV